MHFYIKANMLWENRVTSIDPVKRESLLKQVLCFVACVCVVGFIQAQTADDFFRAIRTGDPEALRRLSANSVNVKDRLDTTPLHYAALYGNTESVRILLEHGADLKARNKSEVTPLIYAAYNFEKTKLLVEKGADVNAKSAADMTPLLVAVSVHGNTETVRYLLEKGADAKAVGPLGADALQLAASKGEAEMLRLLLKQGADPKRLDMGGFNALLDAFSCSDQERIRILMDAGSDVNAANTFAGAVKNGPIALTHMTPLFVAAPDVPPATIKALLSAGAHPDEPDQRKLTPLIYAILTDNPKLATIRQLIDAHADVNAKDENGESVLDWALKYRNPEVIAMLKEAGAKTSKPFTAPTRPADFMPGAPKDAIARSSTLLAKAGETFFVEGGGCVGCHHQPLMARTFASLRAAGQKPDERLRRVFLDAMVANRPFMLSSYPQQMSRGGDFDENLAESEAMIALGEPASATTDAMLHYLAGRQEPSGAWVLPGFGARPPLETGSISRTAMAIRALKTYGWPARRQEFAERIARAGAWLLAAHPSGRYEEADRIMGLKAAGVKNAEIEKAALALIKEQRADGGWSQTSFLDSDAYATGIVLSTLYREGLIKPSDPAYARGVAFLLKTQFPDGSWYVRSRSPKLQPYFQSSFPFDHDQWISTSATAMAVMALAPAM
jgi:ankyrin repeat protein